MRSGDCNAPPCKRGVHLKMHSRTNRNSHQEIRRAEALGTGEVPQGTRPEKVRSRERRHCVTSGRGVMGRGGSRDQTNVTQHKYSISVKYVLSYLLMVIVIWNVDVGGRDDVQET